MLQVYRQYDAYASLSNVDSVDAERRKVVRYVLLLESCVAYLSHLTRISLRAYLVQYLQSVICKVSRKTGRPRMCHQK